MEKKELKICIEVAKDIEELPATEAKLVKNAKEAAQRAYSPYSKFSVGACLLLQNGVMVEGSNQENASYPCGCCAERTALHYAKSQYPNEKIIAIAIVAYDQNNLLLKDPVTPCGLCRQALLEYEIANQEPIKIIMNGANYTYIVNSATDLLPLSFDKNKL